MPLKEDFLPKTKHSLSDHLEAKKAAKHNSDLANLASALEYVEAGMKALERRKKKLDNLKAEILEAAKAIEDGTVMELEEIQDLYNRSRRDSPNL